MTIVYDQLLALDLPEREASYTTRDSMLYALSVGMAADPMDENDLPFVVENGAYGYATATFLGAKAVLSAVKDNNGNWQIVGAESPVLDKEFNNLLKILKATK